MTKPNTDAQSEGRPIPYGRQTIDQADIEAVVEVMRSDWLTTGPKVEEFEEAFAESTGAKHAVALSNGTAALHTMMHAIGIGPDEEVIVPAMTFAATANCVVYQGGNPVFCDVDPETLLIDPEKIGPLVTSRTRAVIAVDYAGQPCDYDRLREVTDRHDLHLVADACHSVGGKYKDQAVGTLADLSSFSFHPVKNMTTGEGGMVTTDDADFAESMRRFRNHGITTDHRQRESRGSWHYEMTGLGYNHRLTDIQCALGLSQLKKLPAFIKRRQKIAAMYDKAFFDIEDVTPIRVEPGVSHAYHLYVVKLAHRLDRNRLFKVLRERGIFTNVHYSPVHLHPFYRKTHKTHAGQCPVSESASEQILSLPMYPGLSDHEIRTVIEVLYKVIQEVQR